MRTAGCRRPPNSTQEIQMKRLIALMLLAMFSTATLTACNTMAGAGKDVQKVGQKVEDKAQDCKDGKC
jgi:predicted small secreted protein